MVKIDISVNVFRSTELIESSISRRGSSSFILFIFSANHREINCTVAQSEAMLEIKTF